MTSGATAKLMRQDSLFDGARHLASALLFFRRPRIHLLLQNVERQSAEAKNHVMKFLQVEFRTQTLLSLSAQRLDFQLANLIGQHLPQPSDITINLIGN